MSGPAKLIDRCNMVYRTDAMRAPDVTVDGHPWERGADYPTFTALVDAVVPAGTFATCVALGMFRLGSAPPEGMRVAA